MVDGGRGFPENMHEEGGLGKNLFVGVGVGIEI